MAQRTAVKTLLTFTGFHDPFASSGVSGSDQDGPVLSLLRLRNFDAVYLISTPRTLENTEKTAAILKQRHPQLRIEVCRFTFENPTDYFEILKSLRTCFRSISEKHRGAEYYIATASGTPQMHACWLLLAASGEIPAKLLQTHNVKFATNDAAIVTEVDLSRPEFPHVRAATVRNFDVEEGSEERANRAVQDLQIVGDDPLMHRSIQQALARAPYDIPVLLTGESGTGKEKIASLIHRASGRSGPFIAVNCSAIPEQLAESILFGHAKGAFTGAVSDRVGKFEEAKDGTLFLDELGELSLPNQAKLLRALQEKQIEPVGGKLKSISCRVIAATNVDLAGAASEKKFREDLYYRIAAAVIELPPLRSRRNDVPKLALHFVDEFNRRWGMKKSRSIAPDALARLMDFDWPGNVRQLCNVIENAAIQAISGRIEITHLNLPTRAPSDALRQLPEPHVGFSLDSFIGEVRSRLYERALELAEGNASKASTLLGCTPQAVQKVQKSLDTTGVAKRTTRVAGKDGR